jgi:hypothetical protein
MAVPVEVDEIHIFKSLKSRRDFFREEELVSVSQSVGPVAGHANLDAVEGVERVLFAS